MAKKKQNSRLGEYRLKRTWTLTLGGHRVPLHSVVHRLQDLKTIGEAQKEKLEEAERAETTQNLIAQALEKLGYAEEEG